MKMNINKLLFLLSCGYGAMISTTSVLAEEGGTGHVSPGSVATLIDFAPTRSGWVTESIYTHYDGDFKKDELPIGGLESLGLKANVDVLTLGALYTFDDTLWGAYYSAGIFVPYVWMDIKGNVNNFNVHDKVQGIGDITLIPIMMAWQEDLWSYSTSLSIYVPSGEYKEGEIANVGLNYWTADPTVSAAYSNEQTGFNFNVYTGVTINSENTATNYKSGSLFHIESSIQQLFPFGKGYMGLGLDAFYFEQITGDSGSGASRDFKGRTMGIGPVVNYILPVGTDNWIFEAKWLPETNTENRLEGDYFWAKVVYQFE